jgi:hypothetical protein
VATVQKIEALTVMPSGYCFNQTFNAISATYSEYDFEYFGNSALSGSLRCSQDRENHPNLYIIL